MTGKETADAAGALLDWLDSQQIAPKDAVPVMLTAVAALIRHIATDMADRLEGGRAASCGLMASLRLPDEKE